MNDSPYFYLAVAFALGYYARHVQPYLVTWIRSTFMATKPTKPRPLGRNARRDVTEADNELASADCDLRPMYQGDMRNAPMHLTNARMKISFARRILTALLGQGVDEDENGNENGHAE
jgi:hypothetical protein